MKQLMQKHGRKLRFGLVGTVNTAIDFGVLFGLTFMGVDKIVANYLSTSIAFVFSFFANRSYTFRSKQALRKQIVPFLLITLAGLWILQPVILYATTPLFDGVFGESIGLLVAKILATVVTLIWNYALYAKFVFAEGAS